MGRSTPTGGSRRGRGRQRSGTRAIRPHVRLRSSSRRLRPPRPPPAPTVRSVSWPLPPCHVITIPCAGGATPGTFSVRHPQAWGVDTSGHKIGGNRTNRRPRVSMSDDRTTAVVQRYLDQLAGDGPAEPIVRALLD